MTKLRQYFLEPVSTLTHLVGVAASVVGLIILLILTRDEPLKRLSLLIYGLSMVLLYSASSLLHGMKITEERRLWLNRLDHMAIFLLIAGTYTPIAYNTFSAPWRWGTLLLIWVVALLGIAYKLFHPHIHGFFNTFIYVLLGWGSAAPLVFVSNLMALIPIRGLLLLLFGGLIYTLGFVIYYVQRPDPWPEVFGHHEIWHLLVMSGSLCHFLFMLFYIVPFERTV